MEQEMEEETERDETKQNGTERNHSIREAWDEKMGIGAPNIGLATEYVYW